MYSLPALLIIGVMPIELKVQRGRVFVIDRFRHNVKNEDLTRWFWYSGYKRKIISPIYHTKGKILIDDISDVVGLEYGNTAAK